MRRDRGLALLATLLLSVGVALLSGTLFLISFLDGAAATNVMASERALYAAEAGLEHTLAILPPAPDFTAAAAWPAGIPPFGAVVDFPSAPVSYRIAVSSIGDALTLIATGTAERGTRRRLEGWFCREPAFLTPAALLLGRHFAPGVVAGAVHLEGSDRDHLVDARPRLAVDDRTILDAARALATDPRSLPLGSGFDAALAALRSGADRVESGPFAGATFGAVAAPEVVRLDSTAEISGTSTAVGLLIADGPLHVIGRLEVTGLLIASGDLQVSGDLVVHGGAHVDGRIDVAPGATLTVEFASEPLRVAGDLRPTVLPRSAFLCGWREVW